MQHAPRGATIDRDETAPDGGAPRRPAESRPSLRPAPTATAGARQPDAVIHVGVTASSTPGGLERVVADLCQTLQTRGWAVSSLFPAFPEAARLRALFRGAGVPLSFGPAALCFESPLPLPHIVRLAETLRRATPEGGIVHLHYPESFLSLRHLLAVRLARRRCVVSFHGVSDWRSAGERKRCITGASHRLCDAVLTNSSAVWRAARSAGVTDRLLRTIPCGTPEPDPDHLPTRAAARARLGIPSDAFVVASAGRLVPRKRIADVLRAVRRLPGDGRPTCLLVAGEGPQRAALEAEAAGSVHGVFFLGYAGAAAMDEMYAAADVFALPSEEEAFGLVYVEAALRSLPSIALAQGGVPDIIRDGETGILLARPGDVEGLTRVLEGLRREPERLRALGAAARERAVTRFTLHVMSDSVEAVYRSLLTPGRSGTPPPAVAAASVLLAAGAAAREQG